MAAQVNQKGLVDPAGYAAMNREINRSSQVYRNALASTGMFRVEQLKINSATDDYTKALQRQKLGFRDLMKQQKVASSAYKEQLAMQQAVVRTSLSGGFNGKQVVDVSFPSAVNKNLDTFNNRLGFMASQLKSGSQQLINWGKNTQWAGRQLMVGFTMPVALAGAATGKFAYDMDVAITKIQKVYDAGAGGIKASNAVISDDAKRSAKDLANLYGQSADNTLGIMQELAAAGKTGNDLRQQTADVSRAMLLGDLNQQDTLKTNITLQSAYNMSTADLANTWNFFNSVENSTVLTMKDISESLPKVAGIMNTLGVSVQDTTTLLTGFKAAGIDVVEGANALKSISFKIFNPSKKAVSAFQQLTGINYQDVIKQGKGQLIPTLTAISKSVEGLNNVQKTQIIGNLAGIYQGSKFAGLLTQLQNIGDATTQIGRANQVAQQSTTDWANTANGELETLRSSISNRLKRAFESLKVELATAGQPFLEVAGGALGLVLKLAKAFNSLPDSAKKIAVITAILLALTGPAIMLVGLFANLIGNFIRMGATILGAATKFELLTKEQTAARLAAKLAETGFISEAHALANLTAEMEKYRLAQDAANRHIMGPAAPIVPAGAGARPNAPGAQSPGGLWIPNNVTNAQQQNAAASQQAAAASQKQSGAMKAVAESGAVFAAGMVASAVSSNQTVDNIANMAMLASIVAPAAVGLAKGLMAVQWAQIGSTIAGKWSTGMNAVKGAAGGFRTQLAGASGMMGKLGLATRLASSGIIGMIGPVGLVMAAVAAGAIAWKIISDNADKARKSVELMHKNPAALGDILGYTPKAPAELDANSKKLSDIQDRVSKMRDTFPGIINDIKSATDEAGKFDIAMRDIGLQVINTGGSVQNAKDAVKLALQAAGVEAKDADAIILKFQAQFDPKGQAKAAQEAAANYLKAANDAMTKKGFSESIKDPLTAVSRASLQNAKDAGEKLAQAIKTAMDANLGQATNMTAMDKIFQPLDKKIADLQKERDTRFANKQGTQDLDAELNRLRALDGAMKRRIITESAGEEAAKKFSDTDLSRMSVQELLANATVKVTDADRYAYLSAKNLNGETLSLAEAQQLSAMESVRQAAAAAQGAAGIKKQGAAARDTRNDLDKLTATFADSNAAFTAYAGAVQSGTKAAMSEYADQATSNFQDRMNAAMDAYKANQQARMDALNVMQEKASKALDARQERDNKRLENRQNAQNKALDVSQDKRRKAIEASYDARIAKIQTTMNVEQAAEDLRQRIFDAEMTRISRMAEAANRNIDFNVALNSGNMDEAAKVMNDSQAAQQQWSLSDSSDAAKNAADARKNSQQAQIDNIGKLKDAKLEQLKVTEDAEKAALAASQDREKTALALRLQNEKDNLAARQKAEEAALSRRIDQNTKAEQKIWDGRKAQLDRAIIDFQNFAPKNAAELQKHIQDISKRYDDFRVVTRGKFNGTAADVRTVLGRNVAQAMQELAANKQWETIGADIAAKMVKGSFNMDMNQFVKWVTTGETPKGWTASKAAVSAGALLNAANQKAKNAKDRRLPAFHVGGMIGVDPGGRAGIQGKLHHSEVPMIGQKGEIVINKKASSKNANLLQAINAGADVGGGDPHVHKGDAADGALGFVGLLGAGMARAASMAITAAVAIAGARSVARDNAAAGVTGGSYMAGKAGKYSQLNFDAEQLNNAATIASVGSSMGMSSRDIQIGIMTAITESMLRNLAGGDRDSIGLFQQRPSQGWGTPAQVHDPNYAARKFFEALKGESGRNVMEPWLAAQGVQRSFDSSGSNYRQYWDEAQAIFRGFSLGGGNATDLGGVYKNAYGRTSWDGEPIDNLTAAQLMVAGRLRGTRYHVTQGSFQPATSYSGTTHTGGGVVDVSPYDNASVVALQRAGFAAWHRGPGAPGKAANYGNHIHAVSLFDRSAARSAAAQAAHYRDMSGDGLGQKYYGPHAPVLANLLAQLPKFKNGGFTISTGLAELHGTRNKPETVLSAPMTDKFKQGVDNFAGGGGNSYDIKVDARGSDLNAEDVTRLVINALDARDEKKPQRRKGND